MNEIPLTVLFGLLFVLLVLSAFFSGSETGLMTMNRYRLKTRAKAKQRSARLAQNLLQRPDSLIGTILLANHFVNALAAAVSMLIALRIYPDDFVMAVAVGIGLLTVVLLIFCEVAPKTVAALHPEGIGLPAAYVLWPLGRLLSPLVWAIHLLSRVLLRLIGITPDEAAQHSLGTEELRTVVAEAGAMIPQRHQKMLLSILDLEKGTVEDIMVPRNEIVGIDISEPWPRLREALIASEHTRLPLFNGSIDDLRGVIHMRRLVHLLAENRLDANTLESLAREPYFIPEGTPLNQQLLNFQNQKRRIGFVVDEYGDIQGLVTLEDILEEVVGEFTSDPATRIKNVYPDADGSYRVSGAVTLRSLNRSLGWKLPMGGPKTVNGLVLEKLEAIPQPGREIEINGYRFAITETRANAVKSARVHPPTAAKHVAPKAA